MPNRPIYIHQHLDDKLRQEPNMSGLINQLLSVHYAITSPGIVLPTVGKAEEEAKKERFERLKKEFSVPNEQVVVPMDEDNPQWI